MIVGGRLGGKFEVDGFAFDDPETVETPSGGADFLDRVLLDGVAAGDAQHVLADQFPEAFERLFLDDGDFGEQVQRARTHGGAGLAVGVGAAGASAVGTGGKDAFFGRHSISSALSVAPGSQKKARPGRERARGVTPDRA